MRASIQLVHCLRAVVCNKCKIKPNFLYGAHKYKDEVTVWIDQPQKQHAYSSQPMTSIVTCVFSIPYNRPMRKYLTISIHIWIARSQKNTHICHGCSIERSRMLQHPHRDKTCFENVNSKQIYRDLVRQVRTCLIH